LEYPKKIDHFRPQNCNGRVGTSIPTPSCSSADAHARIGGRPKRLTVKDVTAAKALLADGFLRSKEVAARFGVSKATLYRYLG
jgi:hypothetical protein